MSPARDERRQAVLGCLATHARVQWNGRGDDVAFADEVLELAGRLGRVGDVPAMRPSRVATDRERRAAMTSIRAVFERNGSGNALSGAVPGEQGAAGVPGSGQQGTTEGDGL